MNLEGSISTPSGYVRDSSISDTENDWLEAIPAKFRRPAQLCLREMLDTLKFNNTFEKVKATYAYMDAFVTAIHMASEAQEGSKDEKSKDKSNQEDQQQVDPEKVGQAFDDNQRSP